MSIWCSARAAASSSSSRLGPTSCTCRRRAATSDARHGRRRRRVVGRRAGRQPGCARCLPARLGLAARHAHHQAARPSRPGYRRATRDRAAPLAAASQSTVTDADFEITRSKSDRRPVCTARLPSTPRGTARRTRGGELAHAQHAQLCRRTREQGARRARKGATPRPARSARALGRVLRGPPALGSVVRNVEPSACIHAAAAPHGR